MVDASAAMNDTPAMTTQTKDPTIYNYLNAGGYLFNTILTFFGPAIFNLPTNSELSERYATLVTPTGWTFSIWLIIRQQHAYESNRKTRQKRQCRSSERKHTPYKLHRRVSLSVLISPIARQKKRICMENH